MAVIKAPLRGGRLDDDRAEGHPGDDPVPRRKVLGIRFGAWRKLRNDRAGGKNLLRKPTVFGWIDDIGSGAEDGNRSAARIECRAMCSRIHTARQTRDDGYSCLGELRRDSFRCLPAIGVARRVPTMRDRCVIGWQQLAADIEN